MFFWTVGPGDNPLHRGIDPAQVLPRRRDIDVDRSADLIMVHLGGGQDVGDVNHRIQPRWFSEMGCAQRHRTEIGNVLHEVLGVLDGQQVIVARRGVDPVARGDHPVGSQRRNEAVHEFLGREAQFARALAVDVDLERRIIHVLGHQHVADAGQGAHLPGDFGGHLVVGLHIHPAHLDIQGRGQPQVEDGIHQAAGLKVGAHLR